MVFFNHAKPEEKKWAQDNSVKFLFSNKNEGISMPYNQLAKLSTKKFILLADDDMYFLPEWDVALRRSFEKEERGMWRTLTVVEPIVDSIWNFNVVMNFGRTAGTFKEAELLSWIEKSPPKKPLMICHRPPNLVRREDYLEVGGWSEEFFPGFCGDPDFAAKFYLKFGEGLFEKMRNVPDSFWYHFSNRRIRFVSSRKIYFAS